jgi:signal transduction histidine kinase
MTERHGDIPSLDAQRPAAMRPAGSTPEHEAIDAGSRGEWARRFPWLTTGFDVLIAILLAALIARLHPAGVPIHAIFAILVVRAFVIDLWGTVARLVAVMAVLTAMLATGSFPDPVNMNHLSEWLLLCALVPFIAILAERRERATRRFGALYRDAASRLVTGEEELRRQVARDLHDGAGQGLGAMMLTIDLLGARVPDDDVSSGLVERSRRLGETVLREVEAVVSRLHPALQHEDGVAGAIAEMVELAAIPVRLSIEPAADVNRLSPAAQTVLFRIVQEALANATRHGHAGSARIEIVCAGDWLRTTIADDGVGFVPEAARGRGRGLVGMEDRATSVGGRLAVASQPGQGTVVSFDLPLGVDPLAPVPATGGRPDGADSGAEVRPRRATARASGGPPL